MPRSDRAFRALARAQPDVIAGLLTAVVPGFLPDGAAPVPDDVTPTQIDALPPELDADFATRVADTDFVHVECQGYRDTSFEPRALWYHLGFALRHRGRRRVRTVAIWLTSPHKGHPRHRMSVDDITVKVTTIVLHEVKASVLLAHPTTACFAPGADSEGRPAEQLCLEVASALRGRNASWAERHMAVVAAAARGRYDAMVKAMEQVQLEPVIIEDLVKIGEDRGRKEGRKEGRRAEARRLVRQFLEQRGLALTPEQEQQLDACDELDTLRRWVAQAPFAESAAAALR